MNHSKAFKAVGASGTYQILEITPQKDTSSLLSPSSTAGLTRFELTDGRVLNRTNADTFVIVSTGEVLTRIAD